MHDPRTSTALRQLADLSTTPGPSAWVWAVARPDPEGRLRLPAAARHALGVRSGHQREVRGICHRVALVVTPAGTGTSLVVDSRGRLTIPVWLRRGADRSLVIGVDHTAPIVVIAPVAVLDGVGNLLAGGPR